jgi:Protein of unknown function (DUF2809)
VKQAPTRSFLWLAATALALGAFVLVYRGPGRWVVRGHVGDVAAAMLVFAAFAALLPRLSLRVRALAAFALTCAVEVGQAFWSVSSTAGHLTLGDTCDPWDIVAYAVGVSVAILWERTAVARCAACASPAA